MNRGAIYCLGPLVLDRILEVDDLPGHDEKAFIKTKEDRAGGPPLNCAHALAQLGEDARLASIIGDDTDGKTLLQWLADQDMSTEAVEVDMEAVTASATIIVDRTGEKAILIDPMPMSMLNAIGESIEFQTDDCVIANFFQPEAIARIFSRAGALGLDRMIDLELPEIERWGWKAMEMVLPYASLVVTNRQVLEAWMTHAEKDISIEDAALEFARLLSGYGERRVVITLGADGLVARNGTEEICLSALKVKPRNTTGAGDVFLAGLTTALRRGRTFNHALVFATACSGTFLERGCCDFKMAESRMKDVHQKAQDS